MVSCVFAKRYDFGCNFWDGGEDKVAPKIVPFSISVLALVANKVEDCQTVFEERKGGPRRSFLPQQLHLSHRQRGRRNPHEEHVAGFTTMPVR